MPPLTWGSGCGKRGQISAKIWCVRPKYWDRMSALFGQNFTNFLSFFRELKREKHSEQLFILVRSTQHQAFNNGSKNRTIISIRLHVWALDLVVRLRRKKRAMHTKMKGKCIWMVFPFFCLISGERTRAGLAGKGNKKERQEKTC